jgi:hypothetical protein
VGSLALRSRNHPAARWGPVPAAKPGWPLSVGEPTFARMGSKEDDAP